MAADERGIAEALRAGQLGLPFLWRLALICSGFVILAVAILLLMALLTKLRGGIDVSISLGRADVWRALLGGLLGAVVAGAAIVGVQELWGRFDPRMSYWRRLPERGQVALERVTLRGAFAFWVPDPTFGVAGGRPKGIVDWQLQAMSPRAQLVLARTGQEWWLHADRVPREWDGRPAPWRTWARDVAIAYAPRTDIVLGIRVEGPEIPVTATDIELAEGEIDLLWRAAGISQGWDLPSCHVTRPEDVRAVDALLRARLGEAADLHAGPAG